MVFWCFPYDQAEAMEVALEEGTPEDEAERKLLGFSLTELTAALNHEWHLSKLLGETLSGPKGANPRSGNLELGQNLAHSVEEGWGGPEVGAVIGRIADYLYKKRDEVVEQVHNNARRAKRTAEEFGAQAASELIPLPGALGPEEAVAEPEAAERAVQLQLDILRELSNMLSERVDLNTLLGTVLEGIYRGIGVDRALFAWSAPTGSGSRPNMPWVPSASALSGASISSWGWGGSTWSSMYSTGARPCGSTASGAPPWSRCLPRRYTAAWMRVIF